MGVKEIQKQLDIIKVLANPKYRKAILHHADKHLVNAICEIIYNVLKNTVNIKPADRAKLLKHKNFLRKLCEKSTLSSKKKILIQRGGFLQL
jgi:hypothetical protein